MFIQCRKSVLSTSVVVLAVALVSGTGCLGTKTPAGNGAVSGKVYLNGNPFTQCIVQYSNESGHGGSAHIQEDGTYSITGLAAGEYRFSLLPIISGESPMIPSSKPVPDPFPNRYRTANTSGWKLSVTGDGEQVFDLEMTD